MIFKKGKIVKIKSWKNLKYSRNDYPIISPVMKRFCGKWTELLCRYAGIWKCDNGYYWRETWFEVEFFNDEDFEI